jgi:tetratricopeptide (TPR) repeat protein
MTRASRWVLAAAIAGSALAVGTVHTITLCVVTGVLAVAAVLAWWGAEPMKARSAATLLLFTGIGLTAYTALQCVPMPIGWLAVIAPHNADVWSRALSPLHEPGPSWAPISLDPTATRVEVLKGVAYLLAFVTALRMARRREGVAFLSAVIVATAIVLALAALLHPAFGTRKLFGVFDPGTGIPDRHIAPLMNPNHLAAYLNVAFCLALASTLSPEAKVPRVITLAIALVLVAVQIWVASRGGVLTMGIGGLLVGFLALAARSKRGAPLLGISILTGVAALAGVAMMAFSSEDAQGELLTADVSKLEIFTQAMRMVPAYPLFGAGRGSFASTFPRFRGPFTHIDVAAPLHVTFAYPENFVAQWVTEWGAAVALAAAIAILWALRPTAALARSTIAAGAWAALVAVAVQNFVDFSSEVPGVVLTLVVSAAIVVGGTAGRTPKWRLENWSTAPRAVVLAGLGATGIAFAASLPGLGRERTDDDEDLREAAVTNPRSLRDLEALARAAILRHPGEPYLPFIVGMRAAQEHAPEAVAWLGATLERAPVYGPAHFVLARVVGARSPGQARLEYRLAMEEAPELVSVVMREAPNRVGGYWDAMELVPEGRTALAVLGLLINQLVERLPATSFRLAAELDARAPNDPGVAILAATAAVEDLEAGAAAPWCGASQRRACVDDALVKVQRVEQLDPKECVGYQLHARVRVASGDAGAGLDELERDADGVSDRVVCLQQLAALALRANDETRADKAIAKVAGAGCAQDDECSRNLSWAADVEAARGNTNKALALYRRAYDRSPERDDLLESAARLAARAGLHVQAKEDYARLALHHPGDARWNRALEAEREAALKNAVESAGRP